MSILKGIPFLRQELTKIFMKRAADKSGIMTVPFKNKKLQLDIEDRLQKYILDAQKQGVDLDMVSNENLKYTIKLNENVNPLSRAISADSPEGRKITEMLLGKKGEVVDMTGKTMDTSQGIMGGKSVAELMKSGQVTKGAKGIKKSKKVENRELFEEANKRLNETNNFVTNTITKIKGMEPTVAMKEANSVIGRKGQYKNLTPEQSKKILQDTEDHIFERDIPIDPEDMADGGVAGLLGERPGFKGGYLASGAKELGKKYKGSTLSAILENPKLLGAELGHDGIMELMRLLPSLFAEGGPARQNFAMGRRAFMKLLGGAAAGIGAAKAGLGSLFKAGKPIATKIVTPNVAGKPVWFDDLVNKVIKEGDDVTKQFATKDREIVHATKIGDDEMVTVTRDLDEGAIRVEYNSSDNMYEDTVQLQYKKPLPDENNPRPAAEFDVAESGPVGRRYGPDDFEIEIDEVGGNKIEDLTSDVSKLKEYATGKKPTIREFIQNKKRRDKAKDISAGGESEADEVIRRQGDYDYANGGLANMLGE